MGRVVMFVLNDVRWDVRVQREATTLAETGYEVTIIGRPTDPMATVPERERWNGVDIIRVPVPGRFRRRMLGAGGGRGSTAPAGATGSNRRTSSMSRLLVRVIRAAARFPVIGGLVNGLDLLVRWRFGTGSWGRAAAAAAPAADVWHAHDLTGLPAAIAAQRRRGGRLVYDSHELFTEAGDTASRPAWARAVLRRYEARAIRLADAVITVNHGLAEELEAIAAPRRVLVVFNTPPMPARSLSAVTDPADSTAADPTAPARPDRLRTALDLPPDARIVLYHGGLLRDRGLPELIRAMASPGLEQVHLVLMGSGPMGPELDRHIAASPDLSARVHRLPPVPPADLGAWVASADVGAMPNQPRTANERISTPNKLFECLAAGIPIVSSDFPERRRIVADDPAGPLGALCDPSDPASIGAALRSILDLDATATATLRARCLTAARERWNWEAQSAGLVALYVDLMPAGAQVHGQGSGTRDETRPQPQRVTFVLPSSGAFDTRTRRMALGLGERGHDVLVIARAEAGLPDREELGPGVSLRRVDAGAAPPMAPGGSRGRSRGPGRLLATLGRMARTAARSRTQTMSARLVDRPAAMYHAMGFLALPVAVDLADRAGAPFVYDARDLYAEGNNIARLPRPLRALFVRQERSWARRAAAVLTVNESLADEIERRLGVARPTVVLNVQAPYELPEPRPDLLRPMLGLPPGTPIVLYHGGFMRDRGLPEVIAAIREPGLGSTHLVLMGSGPQEAELSALIERQDLGGRVHVIPPVPPSKLLDWVASADVGVMANQPRTVNERLSTPNKLFECLAAGTPVVSSDFPERRRIIIEDPDGPLGALCDPTDPASIGQAIRSILDLDPIAAADLRARCRHATAARYDWDTQFGQLLGTYARVTGQPW
ncbi:MAG: glycosyltransferase family 4 protein [Chloroflexota bacterium]